MNCPIDPRTLQAFALMGTVVVTGLVASCCTEGSAAFLNLPSVILALFAKVDSPGALAATIVGLFALPYLPEALRQITRGLGRLTGLEAAGMKLMLAAPTQGGAPEELAAGTGDLWVEVGTAWDRLAPLQEGAVQEGAPPEPQWTNFKSGLDLELQGTAQALKTGDKDAVKRAYAALYRWIDAQESLKDGQGWTGEFEKHLIHTADAMEALGTSSGNRLTDAIARASIFRRGMLLDALVARPSGPPAGGSDAKEIGARAKALFRAATLVDRENAKIFAADGRTTAVLALLVQMGRPEDLDAIAEDCAPRDELEGICRAAREAALWCRERVPPQEPPSTAYGPSLWGLQVLLRARAWSELPPSPEAEARALGYAITLLRGLPVDARHPGPAFRRTAARIAARTGGLPGDDGSALLSLAPELLTDPEGLNALAVAAARQSKARAAELLAAAAALAAPKSKLAEVIAANQKVVARGGG